MAAENIVRLPPFMEIFTSARGSAKNIFALIDRQSKLDPMRGIGKILDTTKIEGNVEFKDVLFRYPSRLDVQVKQCVEYLNYTIFS